MSSSRHYQLWMGGLEPYMTEEFIVAAFRKMGEDPEKVRVVRNKYTGNLLGYCFVNFTTDDHAMDAMHKLNGKHIPGTNPAIRFRLNSARHASRMPGHEREYSIWVGNLSSDVDDCRLYRAFSRKYTSIKQAKVIIDRSGYSKGYGFVRFALEDERTRALDRMNGYTGLGSKPLKVCNAAFKSRKASGILGKSPNYGYEATNCTTNSSVCTHYHDSTGHWDGYNPWQTYDQGQNSWQGYENSYTSYKSYEQESSSWEGYYYPSANCSTETSGAACYQETTPSASCSTDTGAACYYQELTPTGNYSIDTSAATYYQHPIPSGSCSFNSGEETYYQENTAPGNCSTDINTAACFQGTIPTKQSIAYLQQSKISADHSTEPHEEAAYVLAYDEYEDDYGSDVSVENHTPKTDVDKLNLECMEADCCLYDALESSKWCPTEQLENFVD